MKILIIGGGGREHAVAAALAKSPKCRKMWFAPGNGGTASLGQNTGISATDLDGVLTFCKANNPDFVAVLPDDPLALGMVDMLQNNGFLAFGPTAGAAKIESSKAFAKDFMIKYAIPTAKSNVFFTLKDAKAAAQSCALPVVLKLDGLALGKGVIICHTRQEAAAAVDSLLAGQDKAILFEEYLEGPEVTQMAFVAGQTIKLMPPSQDHKRAFDGDIGPNTGGMGAFSPVSAYDSATQKRCMEEIYAPTLKGLIAEGIPFNGILYFSLMLTKNGPMVIEYNARFGDPEAQTVLPLLKSDLLEIFLSICDGSLDTMDIEWEDKSSCCVILASKGYPGAYEKGKEILGLEKVKDSLVFHAGTAFDGRQYTTSGGRVLAVTATGATLSAAVKAAYCDIEKITFDGGFYRKDIAAKDAALK